MFLSLTQKYDILPLEHDYNLTSMDHTFHFVAENVYLLLHGVKMRKQNNRQNP